MSDERQGSWSYGVRAVESLLTQDAGEVQEVWLVRSDRPGPARRRVQELAESARVRVRLVSDEQLRRVLGEVHHQGVAARVAAYVYADEARLLAEAPERALIVALDGVQDPHNLGAIIRSAVGLGAYAVVIPRHRSASVTPAVRRVSTGAVDRIPVARVTNLARFLVQSRDAGFWSYATVVGGGEPVSAVSFGARSVLVMGAEGEGVRDGVLRASDVRVTLPLEGVESLNVSVAAGIFLYAWRCSVAGVSGG